MNDYLKGEALSALILVIMALLALALGVWLNPALTIWDLF